MPAKPATDADALKLKMSDPEAAMLFNIRAAQLPEPKLYYQFYPGRQWEFDGAYPEKMLYYEVDGGIWLQTPNGRSAGHAHPERFESDCVKLNAAALLGWRGFRFTPAMVGDGRAVATLERALGYKPITRPLVEKKVTNGGDASRSGDAASE